MVSSPSPDALTVWLGGGVVFFLSSSGFWERFLVSSSQVCFNFFYFISVLLLIKFIKYQTLFWVGLRRSCSQAWRLPVSGC